MGREPFGPNTHLNTNVAMMWLPLVVKSSSALQTQRWFLKAYIVRSKGCQGLAGSWSAPGKARAKVCMCPGQQQRPGHEGQRVRHRPLKAGQSLCLSHLILPWFFRVAFVYVRLLYYYALEFGATITVLNLCDLFSGKTLHLFVVLGCGALHWTSLLKPFVWLWYCCLCQGTGANSRSLNSVASSNLRGNGSAPSTHTWVASVRTCSLLAAAKRWQQVGVERVD